MKAIVHHSYGSPDVLELVDIERPVPARDQVLVRVEAASVNPFDWHHVTGTPYLLRLMAGLRRPKQSVRGADLAGIVEAVGADVSEFAPGDRVFGLAAGSFAEYAVASVHHVGSMPDGVSAAEAAAMPIAAVTALQGLRDHAKSGPGRRIAINGAAGGVGTFAVQIAVAQGADVTAVCSTRNVEMVAELGAQRVVDYTTADFVDAGPFDAILDNVGNRSLTEMKRALTPDGVLVMVSGKKGKWVRPFDRVIGGKVRFAFGGRTFAQFTASETPDELREIAGFVERGEVRSVIDRHYSLDDTADALRYVATGHARAKVVIDVDVGVDACDR